MTISIDAAFAPITVEAKPEVHRSWEKERDAGVRAFRGVLIAAGLAVAFWGALGFGAWALFQIPSFG